MTKLDKERWEQIRAKGYSRFLLHTIVTAGLAFAIPMTLLRAVLRRPAAPVWELLAEFGFYALFFGSFTGFVKWRKRERDYNRPTEGDAATEKGGTS